MPTSAPRRRNSFYPRHPGRKLGEPVEERLETRRREQYEETSGDIADVLPRVWAPVQDVESTKLPAGAFAELFVEPDAKPSLEKRPGPHPGSGGSAVAALPRRGRLSNTVSAPEFCSPRTLNVNAPPRGFPMLAPSPGPRMKPRCRVLHRASSGRPIVDSLVPEPSKAALGSAFTQAVTETEKAGRRTARRGFPERHPCGCCRCAIRGLSRSRYWGGRRHEPVRAELRCRGNRSLQHGASRGPGER